jgi:O-antigen ligase
VGSGARAAWCGLLVAGLVIAWRVRGVRRPLAIVGGAVMVAVVLAMPLVGTVLERDQGATSRLDEWRVATRVIGNHPVVGVGPEVPHRSERGRRRRVRTGTSTR